MSSIISCSSGIRLAFHTQEEEDKYNKLYLDLVKSTYRAQRLKYGIWASNQNKYVNDVSEFNEFDSTYMEKLIGNEVAHHPV